jgi:glucan phosphoethanolaminetransferase (alkaline phosphatase superfamily)
METINLSVLLSVIGGITVLTNIIVQVLKKITWDKAPTNLVALLVAMVLTMVGGAAYAQMQGIAVTWYMVVAAAVVGFMVAYAAMFGFDKLQEILKGWQ